MRGSGLVAAQLALLGLLAGLGTPGLLRGAWPPDALGLAAAGVALGLWALSANRPGNFNIRPVPHPRGQLVESGPYRWIRHPMYTSLMLAGLAVARGTGGPWSWLALLALVGVLLAKARLEEALMRQRHPGYAAYAARTGRFLPFVG